MKRLLPLLVLAGCGGDDDPDGWIGDDLPLCNTDRRAFRIDALDIPATDDEAEALGRDFDGDGEVENQGGYIISWVDQGLAVDLQSAVDEALLADLVQIGVVIDECESPDYALISFVRGLDLDRAVTPPEMLAEDVTTYAAVATRALPASARDGTTRFPVGQLIHPSAADWIDARELVVVIDRISDGRLFGRLSAGLDSMHAIYVVATGLSAKIAERQAEFGPCNLQVCADETLHTMYRVFDENEDWVVTEEEIRNSTLVNVLLRPDVDTDGDGEADVLSIGVGFRAEPVELFLTP